VDQTLALLVADDPRIQAGNLLDHIVTRCRAKGTAVVTVDSGELASFAGEVPLSRLTALESLWKAEAKDLRAGLAVTAGSYRLLPLMDGLELTGLLFIEGGTSIEKKNPVVIALAAALKAARVHPARPHGWEENVAGSEVERRRLVAALEHHEWNIARVARLIGVTRRTVYLRLKRYSIDRRRVPKTFKPCPPLERA
jgi:transcriptional regulator of acetoin/glycerol metabolism